MARAVGPSIDMRTSAGRAGLSRRLDERRPTRSPKAPKTYNASLRLQAEDLADAFGQWDRIEELCRDYGFEVRVYAKGGETELDQTTTDQKGGRS